MNDFKKYLCKNDWINLSNYINENENIYAT